MKKTKRNLAMILALMVFITSFGFIGAFAEEGQASGSNDEEPLLTQVQKPDAPADAEAFIGYKKLHLEWSKVDGADSYNVYNASGKKTSVGNVTKYAVNSVKNPGSYKVTAVKDGVESDKTAAKYGPQNGPVRPINYKLKIKKSGVLKSHHGPKAKYKVKRGQTIKADGFGGGGKYMFVHNGSTFYVAALRIGSKKADYVKKKYNYSVKAAEYFVNDKGLKSKTKYLVWVSTYTQHMYVFKGSKGKWTCIRHGECSTGKASTPTPTGITHEKTIHKKIRRRHNISWWSPFSEINSIHGKKSSWKLGAPRSNGCVRNYNNNAKYVYKKARIKTKVFVY